MAENTLRFPRKESFLLNKSLFLLTAYFVAYFFFHLLFLTQYPFIHSDESWLSGLTRNMVEQGNLGVTETFYDIKPRYPHAIKSLFHVFQMPFFFLFGYQIFSFRLLSLLASVSVLLVFHQFLTRLLPWAPWEKNLLFTPSFLGMVALSCSIQFIYAAHFARQEILLLLALLLIASFLYQEKIVPAGVITGLSIGLHPNSFLLGMMGLLLLFPGQAKKKRLSAPWKPLFLYSGITGGLAFLYIGMSLYLDPKFFSHYLAYGNSEFDITATIPSKLGEFPYYLQKIWHQVSGTYHVPNIRFELVVFAIALISALFLLMFWKKTGFPIEQKAPLVFLLRGLFGLFLGTVLIGRYNQTSIVFFFPLFFALVILLTGFFWHLGKKYLAGSWNISLLVWILILTISSTTTIMPWLSTSYSYQRYLTEISKVVPSDARVLANLNSEYYFSNNHLRDYRNLSYLKENRQSLSRYLENNKIQYIILSDELDLIYQKRPTWNMIYGNLRYFDELHEFLEEHCTLIHQFQDNVYGIRIIQYMESDLDFTVYIFKVNDFAG